MAKKKVPQASTLQVQIKGIEIKSFMLKPFLGKLTDSNFFLYDLSMSLKVSLEDELLIIGTTIVISSKAESKEELANFTIDCAYYMHEMNKHVIVNEKGITFPKAVLHELSRISTSTTRGVVFGQLRGTYLHTAILPLVDISEVDIIQS